MHAALSSHDVKEAKRKARDAIREQERKKAHGAKQRKMLFVIAAASLAVLIVSYVVITGTPEPKTAYNLTGIPEGTVHWHADVDVVICGEPRGLPYGPAGGYLGTKRLHTHDREENMRSLPGSDGNGVIHTEGVISEAPEEHTLGMFMKNINITFSKTMIMDKKNGDRCGNETGVVAVFLNGKVLDHPENYLPRDKDFIKIEFGPVNETG